MFEHETSISLFGEEIDALVQYEPDPDPDGGGDDILITSVVVRRCTHERGDICYSPDGQPFRVHFPKYAEVEIMPVLLGRHLAELAKQILAEREEDKWDCVMSEPMTIRYNFPTNFPGVRL